MRGVATYLLAGQYLPLTRTAELLRELFGARISQISPALWQADAAAGLDGFDETLKTALIQAPVLGADETGTRVDGALAWVHAARTDSLTRYTVSARRGMEAMKDAGVIRALPPDDTVLVTNFWAPYWNFNVTHAVCSAHLGRELVAAAEVRAGKTGPRGWTTCWPRSIGSPTGPVTSAETDSQSPRWPSTGTGTTDSSRPGGRPTPTIAPVGAGNSEDPNT